MKIKPGVIWFTGLSGAGKTTLAKALIADLKKNNVNPIFLDGDEVRSLFQNHGFDKMARQKHNIEIGKMASFFEKQGHLVIVSLISPYAAVRNEVRQFCENYTEIYVATSLKTCIERDTKGLYQKAINGEILEFTGISAPFEAPTKPEVELNTENHTVNECIKIILEKIKNIKNMYKINTENILFTQLGEEGVVYDIENNEYQSLNETSFKILKSIENGLTEDEILNELLEEYEIEEDECRSEIKEVIEEFLEKNIISNQ